MVIYSAFVQKVFIILSKNYLKKIIFQTVKKLYKYIHIHCLLCFVIFVIVYRLCSIIYRSQIKVFIQ